MFLSTSHWSGARRNARENEWVSWLIAKPEDRSCDVAELTYVQSVEIARKHHRFIQCVIRSPKGCKLTEELHRLLGAILSHVRLLRIAREVGRHEDTGSRQLDQDDGLVDYDEYFRIW